MHLNLHPMIIFQGGTCKSISCWNRNVRDFRKKLTSLYMRVGQKGWKKVHYWLHVVCSQSSHRMNAKYYTTTMWLHFYCIEDGAWIADRFLVVLPTRWRVVWTFLRPIGAKKSFEVAFEFLCTGWFNNWTVDTGTLCVNIFYSKTWAKTGMDLSCLVHMVLINPQPPIYNFTSYWQIFQDFICRLIVWLDQLPSSFFPRCFERPCSPTISRVICRFPEIKCDSLAITESHFDFIKAMNT